jgi:diguanylate cyclase (GGDEF)-like protein/PAS domain S-box-containing protein
MEQSADGLYLISPTGEFIDVNRQACVGLGYGREELLTLSVFDIDTQMTPIRLAENLTGATKGEVFEIESVHLRKDGTCYPVDVRVAALELNGELRLLASVRNITERKEAESHIKHLAYYDSLTDLPNRSLLQDRLKQALATAIRHQHVGALLFLDLDRFKNINDSLGHEVGDELLKQVADRLRLCLREEDTASRLGGDEFVILATELSDCPEEAAEVAIQIVQKVLQIFGRPFYSGGHELYVTGSVGVSLFPLEGQEVNFTDLLRQADTAMYRAKDAGRNGFHFYQPQMQEAIRERLMLEKDMHRALEREEFVLFYQPQVDGTGRLIGAEALLRWKHPEKGLVPPDKFIPVAEETGLILPIGQWVINEACSQLVRWKEAGLPASFQRLAINISPRQFVHEAFVAEFRESLLLSEVDPCYLELELTESMLVDNVEDAIERMNQLKALGLRFSIDDFGTGYSSLRYLQHLPVEQLKIDQSFVRELTSDSSSLAIVEAIIAMSQLLKLQTIAEGVETEAELCILNSLGCEAYQGYYFGRPVPEAEFAGHLNTGLLGR